MIEQPADSVAESQPLMSLDEAVKKIPESLRSQMKELLRAEFREVRVLQEK